MSTDGGRFPFYAVQRGRVPGVYRSWQECEQQVNGYRNSEHRGFRDLVEAMAWLRSAATLPARQPTPPIQTGRRRPLRLLEEAFYSISSSQQVSSGVVPSNSQKCGSGSNPDEQGVVGPDDNVLFGFMVVLPHNGRGLDLVAHDLLCYEERFTRQEVSFTMLDKILFAIDYTILDYNHRIVVHVTAQLNQDKKEEIDRLNERIRKLELENKYRVVRDDLVGVLVGFLVTKILNLDPNGIQFAVGFPQGVIK
ncbi:uncharacterized protein LOC107470270 [Arachis duranensis]|uniref:Ribonuclease H n=1 Tax=Arachis duranensis TaxID=130453 RepID=A0A6P4C9L2_ARADU|nr:uncharacterized protein LOC107470270 [Arachis duranensis]